MMIFRALTVLFFYYKLVTNSSHVILLSPFRCDTASLPAPPCSTVYKSISHAAAEVCEIFPNTAGEMFELMKPISQRRSLLLQLVPSERIETEKLNPLLCFVSLPNTFVGSPAGHPAKPFFFFFAAAVCCFPTDSNSIDSLWRERRFGGEAKQGSPIT